MAWRKLMLRDIAAKLNQRELDAYRQHPDFASAADPVVDLLEMTAESVRGLWPTRRGIPAHTRHCLPTSVPTSIDGKATCHSSAP